MTFDFNHRIGPDAPGTRLGKPRLAKRAAMPAATRTPRRLIKNA